MEFYIYKQYNVLDNNGDMQIDCTFSMQTSQSVK